jgi:hypothetical protein
MKQIFALILAVLFVFVGAAAFACGGPGEPRCTEPNAVAYGDVFFQAPSYDFSFSKSNWGWGNDWAMASGGGAAGGEIVNFASAGSKPIYEWDFGYYGGEAGGSGWYIKDKNPQSPQYGRVQYFRNGQPENSSEWSFLGNNYGWHKDLVGYEPGFAYQGANGFAWSKTDTYTFAIDFGTTSMAGAFGKFEGFAIGGGIAIGDCGDRESSLTTVYLQGGVGQANYAEESGYSFGSFVQGGNESYVDFTAQVTNSDTGRDFAASGAFIGGSAITGGNTVVSIDPYGATRSISACTGNFASFGTNGTVLGSSVTGDGFVAGLIQNGANYAGGSANFAYNGANYGAGGANLNATIWTGANSSTASVSASSFATVTGPGSAR